MQEPRNTRSILVTLDAYINNSHLTHQLRSGVDDVHKFYENLANQYDDFVKVNNMGTSIEGRNIPGKMSQFRLYLKV